MTDVFYACADLHLDPCIWRKYRQIHSDSYRAFEQIVDAVIAQPLPLVICGDIFEISDPHPAVIKFFREQLDKLATAQVPVYCIQGNHDKRPVPWCEAIHAHVHYVGDGQPFRLGSLTCVGLDYNIRTLIEPKIREAGCSKPDVMFIHQLLKEAFGLEGVWNATLEWVPLAVKLLIAGDVHSPWQMTYNGFEAIYPGATHARNVSEINETKRFLKIDDSLKVTDIKLRSRSMRIFNYPTDALDEVRAYLSASDSSYLPAVAFIRTDSGGVADVRSFCNTQPVGIVICESVTAVEVQTEMEDIALGFSPAEILKTYIDPIKHERMFNFATKLREPSACLVDVIRDTREQFYKELQ